MRAMPIPVDTAVHYLAADRPVRTVPGGPRIDFSRSPAAARVGELAAENGLFLFHFEHRVALDLPYAWVEAGRDEDARPPEWIDGVLPERKYQSYRHDLMIGSFHPGHRGKWTTHELCHGLVGFAWRPDATPFFHATAGRLAELLPVALWYFFDEFRLQRCREHQGGGALFQTFCGRCEAAAAEGPREWDAERWIRGGIGYFQKEIDRIDASLREGRPIANRWFQIDLSSDGVAYARGHARRLSSDAMRRFAEQFLVPGGGYFDAIGDLRDRAIEVARGILLGDPVRPWAENPEVARDRWIVQDVAWRLLQIRSETAGEAAIALDRLIDRLAVTGSVSQALSEYATLHAEVFLPAPAVAFAVGYDLAPDRGRGAVQIREGLQSVCPLTVEAFEDAGVDPVTGFVASDVAARVPLAERWARWLDREHPEVSDLARYELALRTAGSDGVGTALGPRGADDRVRLAEGARILTVSSRWPRPSMRVRCRARWSTGGSRCGIRPAPPPKRIPTRSSSLEMPPESWCSRTSRCRRQWLFAGSAMAAAPPCRRKSAALCWTWG